jgi:DNA-binding NarL/FixJ family response regulator
VHWHKGQGGWLFCTLKQIAALLHRSEKTIEAHRIRLMNQLDIHDVAGLVRYAIRTGLVSSEK